MPTKVKQSHTSENHNLRVSGQPSATLPLKNNNPGSGIDPDWWSKARQVIMDMEYEISWLTEKGVYQSPNRAQNLIFTYQLDGFIVKPRQTRIPLFDPFDKMVKERDKKFREISDWSAEFSLDGVAKGKDTIKFTGNDLSVTKNTASVEDSQVRIHFTNNGDGMRQDFIVKNRFSAQDDPLTLSLRVNTTLALVGGRDGVELKDESGKAVMHYDHLKVWDANHTALAARMEQAGDHEFSIIVDDRNAVYPITVDPLSSVANWEYKSGIKEARIGEEVASAGDVNGDGYSDVLVSVGYQGGPDAVVPYCFYGSPSGLSITPSWSPGNNANFFHASVACAGDVNGDGYSDIIIGTPHEYNSTVTGEGCVSVFYGGSGGLSTFPSWVAEDPAGVWSLGMAVSTTGDVNGDGYSDIMVNAESRDENQYFIGAAEFVWYGGPFGLGVSGTPQNADWKAEWLANTVIRDGRTAGDVNGDGYSDIICGIEVFDDSFHTIDCALFVWYGGSGGLGQTGTPENSDWKATSDFGYAQLGWSVSTAGDVNGDGYSDIVAGAFLYPDPGPTNGKAFAWYGGPNGLGENGTPSNADWSAGPDPELLYFGMTVSTAGDVNGDGYSDIIIGQDGRVEYGEDRPGKARVYFGSPAGLSPTENWSVSGSQPTELFATSVSGAGDVNGDGFSDVIIGAPLYTDTKHWEGRVVLYNGGVSGLADIANWTADGGQVSSYFGVSVASAGDVNGDGYSDVIAGADMYTNGFSQAGKVFVYFGSKWGLPATASWTAESDKVNSMLGHSVSSAGDVNGDGYSDIIVGAYGYINGQTDEGKVFVWYGGPLGLGPNGNPGNADWSVESDQAYAQMGWSVSTAGDVNGDGFSDVIIGAPGFFNNFTSEGGAFIFLGSASGLAITPAVTVVSGADGANLGYSVSTAGDVNGDGYADVIAGAPGFSSGNSQTYEGKVLVFHGSATGVSPTPDWTKESNQASAQLGWSVASAGDVNGDGFSDIVAGAPNYDYSGGAFIFNGSAAGLSTEPTWSYISNQGESSLGNSVSTAGDVNGDGYSDVIIGARYYDHEQVNEGKAYLFYGNPSGPSLNPDWTSESNQVAALYGYSVATAGDVNGDGYSDVIIGSMLYENVLYREGRTFLYYGNATGGFDVRPRQFRADLITPVATGLATHSISQAGVRLYGRTFCGRTNVKIQFEVKPLGTMFNGIGLTESGWIDPLPPGLPVTELVSGLTDQTMYKWRVRYKYNLVKGMTQVYSKWIYPNSNGGLGEADFKVSNNFNIDAPATQATNIVISNVQSAQFSFNWTDGDGSSRAVFIKQASSGSASPANHTTYSPGAAFETGTQIGSTGWFCIFNGTSHPSDITVTALSPGTTYRIMVCEYNGTAGDEAYNTSDAANNPVNQVTCPVIVPSVWGNPSPCIGAVNVMYSTDFNKTNYSWSISAGGNITGGNNTSIIQVTWNSSGNQWVKAAYADANGCIPANPTQYDVVVNPLPSAAGAISGPGTVTAGQTGVVYSVGSIANAIGYTWTLPMGAFITSGTNTNNITVTFGSIASSGIITVKGTNNCGNGTISADFSVTVNPFVQAMLGLNNVTVANGQTNCYNAQQTITVAGSGSYFLVNSGGSATLIAGQNIIFLPGTKVSSGGYMNAYISTNGNYCSQSQSLVLKSVTDSLSKGNGPSVLSFRVYPNPTPGDFTLEFIKKQEPGGRVEIYGMFGKCLYRNDITNLWKQSFSITDLPAGIYVLKVVSSGGSGLAKIIKTQ